MIETLGSLLTAHCHVDALAPSPANTRSESILSAIPGSMAYDALTFGAPTHTGRSVNPNTAMTYSGVWAAVKILAESESSTALLTYRNLSADGLNRELAVTDYRYRLLREQPNEEMSSGKHKRSTPAALLPVADRIE